MEVHRATALAHRRLAIHGRAVFDRRAMIRPGSARGRVDGGGWRATIDVSLLHGGPPRTVVNAEIID
jgi:hypothetical protein